MRARTPSNPLPLKESPLPERLYWIAIVSRGIEEVAAQELRQAGAKEIEVFRSGIQFQADLETLYGIHLQVGSITRVLYPIREFAAAHSRMLYDQVRRVAWEKLIQTTDTIAVECTASQKAGGVSAAPIQEGPPEESRRRLRGQVPTRAGASTLSQRKNEMPSTRAGAFGKLPERRPTEAGDDRDPSLRNTHYVALKIKDAIVDRIREETGARPSVDTESPKFKIFAHLSAPSRGKTPDSGRCSLSLDATGTSLHERGYRALGTLAPLRETLASAIVSLTGWDGSIPLLDPMCGSGTLLIEAARKALRVPNPSPADRFAFMNWPSLDSALWEKARATAENSKLRQLKVPILGFDSSSKALSTAKQAARAAKVEGQIAFLQQELRNLNPPPGPGILLTNPPYGERVGNVESLKDLYYLLGTILRERFQGWTAYILSGNPELTSHLGLKASQKFPLYNGAIECRLLKYEMRLRRTVEESPRAI